MKSTHKFTNKNKIKYSRSQEMYEQSRDTQSKNNKDESQSVQL